MNGCLQQNHFAIIGHIRMSIISWAFRQRAPQPVRLIVAFSFSASLTVACSVTLEHHNALEGPTDHSRQSTAPYANGSKRVDSS
jgi:hypothetical protein